MKLFDDNNNIESNEIDYLKSIIALEELNSSINSLEKESFNLELLIGAMKEFEIFSKENITDDNVKEFNIKFNTLCSGYGIENDYLTDLSVEALISKKEGTTGFIKRGISVLTDIKDKFIGITNLGLTYKIDKLKEIREKISNDELVSREKVNYSDNERLSNKLSTFFVLGNSLKNGADDLISYLDTPVSNLNNGFYNSLFKETFALVFSNPEKVKKEADKFNLNIDLSKLKMSLKIDESEYKNVYMSFPVKRFGNELYLYTYYSAKRNMKEGLTFDSKYGINIDMIKIKDKYKEDISILNKKEILKLLDYLIDNEIKIKKALNISKLLFLKHILVEEALRRLKTNIWNKLYGTKTIAENVGSAAIHSFNINIDRSFKMYTVHLANITKDIVWYDNLIIDYVLSTYKEK